MQLGGTGGGLGEFLPVFSGSSTFGISGFFTALPLSGFLPLRELSSTYKNKQNAITDTERITIISIQPWPKREATHKNF